VATPGVGRHYQGELGEQYYACKGTSGVVGAQLVAKKFRDHIAPHDVVVDFGCGAGFLLEQLPGASKIGIEPNPVPRKAANARGIRVVASPGDVEDAIADIVVSHHVLEHTLRPIDELGELRRILRPGGRLHIRLPLDDWRRQRRPDPSDTNHHLFTWTPQLIANLLDEAGFVVGDARVVTHAWPPKHELLHRVLPSRAFDLVARGWSIARKYREVAAHATKPS
jgi:SAM-dependent methyltransferase